MTKCFCPPRAAAVAVAGVVCLLATANGQQAEKQKEGAKFSPAMMPVRTAQDALYNAQQRERFLAQSKQYARVVPPNDLCANASPLSLNVPAAGSTTDATVDPGAGTYCGTSITSPGVWYAIDGTGNTMTASLCTGTSYDTKISVFCGDCASPICVAGNDDACSVQSEVSWCSSAGSTYLILVHGFSSSVGDFTIVVTDDGSPCDGAVDCTPVGGGDNDFCDNATPLSLPASVAGSTVGATPDSDVSSECGTTITAPGVWYSFVGTGHQVTASLCGSSYDTKISVFTGTCDAPVCVTGNDDFCSLQSEVSFCANSGLTYYILVHGFSSSAGDFVLDVFEGPSCECADVCQPGDTPEGEPVCYNEYDDQYNGGCNSVVPAFSDIACGDSICGTSGTFLFDDPIYGPGTQYRDTDWYRVTLPTSQILTWTVTGNFPTLLGIVDTGGIDDCSLVSAFLTSTTTDPCVEGQVSALVPAGTWYLFVSTADFTGVNCGAEYHATLTCAAPPTGACCLPDGSCADGLSSADCDAAGGSYQGDDSTCDAVSCPQPQGNDLCEDAYGPLDVPSSTIGTTDGATIDMCAEPDIYCYDCGAALITSPGVWYSTIGTGNTMTASLCTGTDYDTKLSVYCGTCDEPVCIDGNDDYCDLQSQVTWCSQPGAEYLILVHGYGGATGPFELTISDDGAPCSGAVQCLPEGACCFIPHECIQTTEGNCDALGGDYLGDDTLCATTFYAADTCDTAFEDISTSGTLGPSGDDEGEVVSLGFTFEFYGVNHASIGLSTNGYATFGSDLTDFSNDPIPDENDPNDLIAPLWDDYDIDEDGGSVTYQTLGTAPNRRFIAQWTDVHQFFDTDSETFQLVLYEADNSIEFHYGPIEPEDFAGDRTVGIENPDGTDGVDWGGDNVATGDCVRFEAMQTENPCNYAPDCTTGNYVTIWPPNHKAVAIDVPSIANVTDPEGDPVTLTITSITQDEPINCLGDGNTTCDGVWVGTTAYVRAERGGTGNGRVYRINYTACDDFGDCCDGYIEVHVPHSDDGQPAIDDGQDYDSTPCYGKNDVNADGVVNSADLQIVIDTFGQIGPDENLEWPDGDVNADARVDTTDVYMVIVAINNSGNWDTPTQPQPTSRPARLPTQELSR